MIKAQWLELVAGLSTDTPPAILRMLETSFYAGARAMHYALLESPEAKRAVEGSVVEHSAFLGGIAGEVYPLRETGVTVQ